MVYLPTKLGDFVRVNVGKYSSTMEHMGMIIYPECYILVYIFDILVFTISKYVFVILQHFL